MSDFVEDLPIQSLQRKLKTAMEIADSATIIVLEREKQIIELEQQLKTAKIDTVNDATEYIRLNFHRTCDFEGLLEEYANNLEGK